MSLSMGEALWANEETESARWSLAHDPVALLADAKRQHLAKLSAEKEVQRLQKIIAKPRGTVYLVVNDCPEDWDRPGVLGVFRKKCEAEREAKIIIGGNAVAMQYVIVQKWRLK